MDETAPWHFALRSVVEPFRSGFAAIDGFHRFVLPAAESAFSDAVERANYSLDPAEYDLGDVVWTAEEDLGISVSEVSEHLGLMVIVRALSLAESTLARMAAKFFKDPQGIVYTASGTWTRDAAQLFYETVLARPFDIDSLGMGTISKLRNSYVHGYGAFPTWETARETEDALISLAGTDPATPAERALGFGDESFVLGPRGRRQGSRVDLEDPLFQPTAHLSPLVAHRLLGVIRNTVERAFDAAAWGPKTGDELESSKFYRTLLRQFDAEAGESFLAYRGSVEVRLNGRRVDLLNMPESSPTTQLVRLMRDGTYEARIDLQSWRPVE